MARLRADESDAVKIAKVEANLAQARSQQTHVTLRYLIVCSSLLGLFGILAWVVVKVNEKPAWLQLILILVTSVIGPSLFWLRVRPRLKRALDEFRARTGPARDEPSPGTGGPP